MKFSDIIGQADVKRMLVRGVDSGRIGHAQLFEGLNGYGALPLALAYAQYINCGDRQGGDSCGVCGSCVKIDRLAHPDLHFVFPVNSAKASGSGRVGCDSFLPQFRELFLRSRGYFDEQMWYQAIDIANKQGVISRAEAEDVIRKLSYKSFEANHKVVIIWMPERMRAEAANALLKILEEPWERTLFLLVSESPHRLLPTILSRMQNVMIPRLSSADVELFLAAEYDMDADRRRVLSKISGGDIIESTRLAADGGGEDGDYFERFMELMRFSYNDRHMELLEWAEGMASLGREPQKRFFANSVRLLRESYMLHAGMDDICYLCGEELDFCKKFSPYIGNHNIEKLADEMELASAHISQNGNARIVFSHFALTVSKMINKL